MTVLAKVAHTIDDVDGLCYNEGVVFDMKNFNHASGCECEDGLFFRQRHSTFLQKLERQFRSFPQRIRRELLHWFISKHQHGYEPFMINPSFDPNMNESDEQTPVVFYGDRFCSNAILQTHNDYGKIANTATAKGCNCHGI